MDNHPAIMLLTIICMLFASIFQTTFILIIHKDSLEEIREVKKLIIAGKQEAIGIGTTAAMSKPAMTSLFSVVYVTVPSVEVGKKIARDVVGKRLAACVNIVPQLTSVYEWKGQMQEDTESMLIIKTGTDRLPALKEAVIKQHPYEVPEFISLPIEQGSEPYLKWIREQTTGAPVNETKQQQ